MLTGTGLNVALGGRGHKRDIVGDYANFSSEVYAPLTRNGRILDKTKPQLEAAVKGELLQYDFIDDLLCSAECLCYVFCAQALAMRFLAHLAHSQRSNPVCRASCLLLRLFDLSRSR